MWFLKMYFAFCWFFLLSLPSGGEKKFDICPSLTVRFVLVSVVYHISRIKQVLKFLAWVPIHRGSICFSGERCHWENALQAFLGEITPVNISSNFLHPVLFRLARKRLRFNFTFLSDNSFWLVTYVFLTNP